MHDTERDRIFSDWLAGHKGTVDAFRGGMAIPMILVCVWSVAVGVWEIRRQARDIPPRKRRLEALLKALEAEWSAILTRASE